MRSKHLSLERYKTDKIESRYLDWYDPIFQPLVDREIRLLEIGVHEGGSLRLWRDYFPRGWITGIDLQPPGTLASEERIRVYQGDQADKGLLTRVATECAPEGFDVIIDDASHIGSLTRTTFWHLFDNHLKPSGLYVIEDWGTGYWEDWPDGRKFRPRSGAWSALVGRLSTLGRPMKARWHSHDHGMVGFVKELVEEEAGADLWKEGLRG